MLPIPMRVSVRGRIAPSSSSALSAHRGPGRRIFQRFQSTTGTSNSSSAGSHIAAGVVGGAVVIVGVYAWYHFSGVKTAVDASKAAHEYFQQAKRAVTEQASKNSNELIDFFRKTAKQYAFIIPGASNHVDAAFDVLDELQQTHGEEVNKILQKGHEEISKIFKDSGSGIGVDTGMKVMNVLRQSISELNSVRTKAQEDALAKIGEKYPEVKEKLSGGYEQLKQMTEERGPEAKKILEDATKQIQEIFSKGLSPDGLKKAQELVQSKTSQIREMAQSPSQDTWNAALKEAQPHLEKLPDIKKLIEENAGKFLAAGAAQGGVVQEVFAKVKEVAEGDATKNKQKVKELQEFVQKKAQEAQEGGSMNMERAWKVLQDWVRTMPGGEEMLKQAPEFDTFAQLARERGDDAKRLTKETYQEIMKVLKEKGKEAQELASKTREEAKKS